MASGNTKSAPNWPSLPDPPSGDFWSDTQWQVLLALLDATIPSIAPESKLKDEQNEVAISDATYAEILKETQSSTAEPPNEMLFQAYMEDRPSANPAFVISLRRAVVGLPEKPRGDLGKVLGFLSTKMGSYLLTGYGTPLHQQPVRIREAILQGWKTSWLPILPLLHKSITLIAKSTWTKTSSALQQVTGYPDVPRDWKAGPDFDFNFLQFPRGDSPVVIETDVVIVGSGCGGGVCAKVLSEAGHSVLVVDKGYYYPPSQLPMTQEIAGYHLFENRGFISSTDASTSIVAGSCWGGGGTVNWSVGLQTQGFVRREWAEDHGLPFFATQEFQDCLDRVCGFMGVSDAAVRQPHRGQVLLDGARKLGWHAKPTPQNTGGKAHWCGHCHLGCGSAEKQGPAVSWLPAAARAGAKFVEGFEVERVTFDESSGEKRATGVIGKWTSRDSNGGVIGPQDERVTRDIVVKAKKVIVSSGSLWSPVILLKSGLKNRHIGRNLHLHPVNFLAAFYEDDVRPWEGGILTSVCTTFEDLDNHGHGVKLEPTCMLPQTILTGLPWHGGLDFKLAALKYRHLNAYISLCRDRDTGSVTLSPTTGRPVVHYTPSAFDAAHVLEGVVALAKICYVTGATEIHAGVGGTKPFVRAAATSEPPVGADSEGDEKIDLGAADPAFTAWLDALRAAGNRPPGTSFTSAHQMGTCRMSSHEGAGVVDPRGRVWGAEGLYVADASVFPSASGVNPMVTNMAIADWIAGGVTRDLNGKARRDVLI